MKERHKIVIIGSGGHAKVIIDMLRSLSRYEIIGCTDPSPKNKAILGITVLGDDSILPQLHRQGVNSAFVAIGDNRKRNDLAAQVSQLGFHLINVVSPFTSISKTTRWGVGIAIMPGVVINPDTTLQDHVIINTGATIDHDCLIESDCHIAPGCHIAGNVKIGKGSFLGVGCKVIPDITIGPWSIIGAGSVVVNDLPRFSLAIGNPAKVVKQLTDEK